MSNHEPGSRLASTLLERFGNVVSSADFGRLSHNRLMEESQRRLANAVVSGQPIEERVATRILDNTRDYRRWEDEHAMLMRRIAAERLPGVQKVQLLEISFALVHRKALFEYLRDEQVRGVKRNEIMAHFFANRDYTSAVVHEHGCYVRSAASYLCSSHVGSNMMFDTLFETPLAEYEEIYASYFRTYCNTVLASDNNVLAKSMLPVLVDLKTQIGEYRKALVALTHSQSGIWRRPVL
ncbi:MAG TPA: hypothetical protein VJT10_09815 [Steroidobacteraceae bacterium]|nr:hypothetical protein [Steroidobacteraceae bacterium]